MTIKYIFCINSGRSGSDYLTGLLAKATNTVSVHEGLPIMNGRPMQAFNQGHEADLRALMPLKLAEIGKQSRTGQKIYCETNHTFIKGWGYLIPEQIPQEEIGVIILTRDPDNIAYSLLRLHDVPGASEWSRTWYLTPGASRDLSRPPEEANPFDMCKWYVEEVTLRADAYKKQFPNIAYFECDLDQLNDFDFVRQMFDLFGLLPGPDLKATVGRVLNPRDEWPKLPLDVLLAPPRYPSADGLEVSERDALVSRMVTYLREHKAEEIAALQPDPIMGGTLAFGLTDIFSHAERELEEAFQVSLMFTETEWILISEFLYAINPKDFMFLVSHRSGPPGLVYSYDFNRTISLKDMVRIMGLGVVFKFLWLTVKGLWKRDMTHRRG